MLYYNAIQTKQDSLKARLQSLLYYKNRFEYAEDNPNDIATMALWLPARRIGGIRRNESEHYKMFGNVVSLQPAVETLIHITVNQQINFTE